MRVLYFTATLLFFSLVPSAIGGISVFGQNPEPAPSSTPQQSSGGKRNVRPTTGEEVLADKPAQNDGLEFRYVFTQPNFVYSRMVVEHDSSGRGRFSFDKTNNAETIAEVVQISPNVVDRIRAAYAALNFLESDEDYQHRRDYSHLGNVDITLSDGGRSRTARFNWTENPHARALMDDYRRLTQQFTWILDIGLARENQPLDSPNLMASLENLLRRNEIADPQQLLPFLEELAEDERLPLIARNRARSIIASIRKK